jgi:16S rRNA processing protein RimM
VSGRAEEDPDRLIAVGRVGRPHGLDGAFVVERASDDPARYRVGTRLVVDGTGAEIVASRAVGKGRVAIRLDRAVSRGAELAIRRSELPPSEPDTWYAFELEGLVVEDEAGSAIGRVTGVHPGAANDNVELEDGTLIPLIDDALVAVDLERGRIVVRGGFLA